MTKKNNDIRTFNMRVPKEIWLFLKKTSAAQEISMTEIIIRCITKYKKKLDNKLTDSDTYV